MAIDQSGDVDQKKPFTLPIAVRNLSDLFTARAPFVICHFKVVFDDSKGGRAEETGHDQATKAHPVVPGSSTYRGGGRNLKWGWVSSFRVP